MAPSRKISRKTLKKKKKNLDHLDHLLKVKSSIKETNLVTSNLCTKDEIISNIGCTTPKAQKYKIPKILTCPHAPKKQRGGYSSCIGLRRTPISFFDPPDIELFFASHLTSVYT